MVMSHPTNCAHHAETVILLRAANLAEQSLEHTLLKQPSTRCSSGPYFYAGRLSRAPIRRLSHGVRSPEPGRLHPTSC